MLLVVEVGEAFLLQIVLEVEHLPAQQQRGFGRAAAVGVHGDRAAVEIGDCHQRHGEDGETDHHFEERETVCAAHRFCPGASTRSPTTFTRPVSGATSSEKTSSPCARWMAVSSVKPLDQK